MAFYLDIKINGPMFLSMETGSHIRLIFARTAKAMERVDRESIAEIGLIPSEFGILEALLHKGPLPINIIAQKVLLTSGSMTAAANRLERRGLVERVADPTDGRRFHLHLTPEGTKVITTAYAVHSQNLEQVADALTPEERDELVRLLKKIGLAAEHSLTVKPQDKQARTKETP